jgi:drug/metabolite transporter (DMT)-like permease
VASLLPAFAPAELASLIEKHKANCVFGGPAHFKPLLDGGLLLVAAIIFTVVVVNIFGHGAFYWLLRRYDASLIAPMTLMALVISSSTS